MNYEDVEEFKRDFQGIWIPAEIWLDERLSALDKIILVEIDSLDSSEEGCFASNKYLSEFCQCTETKVSTAINKLINLGYLEVVKFDGRKRYLKSRIKKIKRQTLKNLKADFKKFKYINIVNNKDNNIINNKKENIKEKYGVYGRVKLTKEEYSRLVKEFGEDFIKGQINLLDEYIESNNNKNKYTNFNLVIRKSIRDGWFKRKEEIIPNWFDKNQDLKIMSKQEEEEIEKILKDMESE